MGAGNEMEPSSTTGDSLAFTHLEIRRDIWSLPFDLKQGKLNGVLERVTEGPAWREHASLSRDGRYLAFASAQSGRSNIWVRDLATGKESHVVSSSLMQRFPVINASGSRIAFSVYEVNGRRSVYLFTQGGAPEKMCEDCLRATDWSQDEKTLLLFGSGPYQINILDVASHRQTALLKHATWNLLYGHFSPDNRWISFTARIQPNRAHIMIAPIDRPKPVPERLWIKIAEGAGEDWANWSPDGKDALFHVRKGRTFLLMGTADRNKLPSADGRAFRRTAFSRSRFLSARRLVRCGWANCHGARRGHRQYLDDVALRGALITENFPPASIRYFAVRFPNTRCIFRQGRGTSPWRLVRPSARQTW